MSSAVTARHADWLSLVEPSGPYLSLPVLRRVWPAGLERTPAELRAEARARLGTLDLSDPAARTAWVEWLLGEVLQWGKRLAGAPGRPGVPEALTHVVAEHACLLRPDYALMEPALMVPAQPGAEGPGDGAGAVPGQQQRARALVMVHPPGRPLTTRIPGERWSATPVERLGRLCRANGVQIGLATNGADLTMVWAPPDAAAGHATFPTGLFGEEPVLLDALRATLGASRFFAAAPGDQLEALLAESASAQAEVTGQLGRQVLQAVELLVAAISRANRERQGALLEGVTARQVYEAAVSVLMRLVVLLFAEERQLLPLGDELYDRSYAASTLLESLRARADLGGDEPLERSHGAWYRLLALSRAVHGGLGHDRLRIPAYGGTLFDPDRFAFLEGRRPGQPWAGTRAEPLAVDDLAVMAILAAITELELREAGVTETRRLTYRSLDVEQIGHVYEGLLDHSAVTAEAPMVGLVGRAGQEAEVALSDLEVATIGGDDHLAAWLVEQTNRTSKRVAKALGAPVEAALAQRLRAAVDNDEDLAERLWPFAHLLRTDLRGLPVVFLPGTMFVTKTGAKRDSGTAYTTRALADEVVTHALEPLVYSPGPAEGAPPGEWRLRCADELLALRVCDPAVGSGAFLVAACRYLAQRLTEAWLAEGAHEGADPDELATAARRAVVDRCLYGVDRDPMAAEMAKLSLWLVTMAKERPFSFLDHAVKAGDSLLGLTSLDQVRHLHLDPDRGRAIGAQGQLFGDAAELDRLVKRAVQMRRQLTAIEVLTVRDAEAKAHLEAEAAQETEALRVVADALVGAALSAGSKLDNRLAALAPLVGRVFDPSDGPAAQADALHLLSKQSRTWLDADRPPHAPPRRPLHWPLAFPEVFVDRARPGFDAMIGNPPFLGGKRISGPMGTDYREYLVRWLAGSTKGNADLVAYFFLRAAQLAGALGLLATNTIAQGDTREVALDRVVAQGWTITRAVKSVKWPGEQALEIAKVWMVEDGWKGQAVLSNKAVAGITPSLDPVGRATGNPERLVANAGQSFQGSIVLGLGFTMSPAEAQALIDKDPANAEVLFPYLNGEDLNTHPRQQGSRWIINFGERTEDEARQYHDCWAIVEERVRPERVTKDGRKYPRMVFEWWKYWNARPGLYAAIAGMDRVLVMTRHSSTVSLAFVGTGAVFSDATTVFAYDDNFHFGLLCSGFHYCWAVLHASTIGAGIRYTPTDCFETFPQPPYDATVEAAGRALDQHRAPLMVANDQGLTKTYNRVHDPADQSRGIVELRRLHVELDRSVADAYGWADLDFAHGFWDTSQGRRFTIGPTARSEVLDRLLELNHHRYGDEVAAALHKKPRRANNRRGARLSTQVGEGQVAPWIDPRTGWPAPDVTLL